jgi:hypothetical protein
VCVCVCVIERERGDGVRVGERSVSLCVMERDGKKEVIEG